MDISVIIPPVSEQFCTVGRNQECVRKEKWTRKKTTAKCKSFLALIRAKSKINCEVLMYESYKSPSYWSNATSTEINTDKGGAACKNPELIYNLQQGSARIGIL